MKCSNAFGRIRETMNIDFNWSINRVGACWSATITSNDIDVNSTSKRFITEHEANEWIKRTLRKLEGGSAISSYIDSKASDEVKFKGALKDVWSDIYNDRVTVEDMDDNEFDEFLNILKDA